MPLADDTNSTSSAANTAKVVPLNLPTPNKDVQAVEKVSNNESKALKSFIQVFESLTRKRHQNSTITLNCVLRPR